MCRLGVPKAARLVRSGAKGRVGTTKGTVERSGPTGAEVVPGEDLWWGRG